MQNVFLSLLIHFRKKSAIYLSKGTVTRFLNTLLSAPFNLSVVSAILSPASIYRTLFSKTFYNLPTQRKRACFAQNTPSSRLRIRHLQPSCDVYDQAVAFLPAEVLVCHLSTDGVLLLILPRFLRFFSSARLSRQLSA